MNDVISELQELNEDRFNSIELPDEDDLVVIEEEILISLPTDLKEFLLYGSNVITGSISPVTASDPNLHTHLPDVTATAWSHGLPRHLIPVCEASGGYYFISQEGSVGFWTTTEDITDQQWETLWEWITDVWIH